MADPTPDQGTAPVPETTPAPVPTATETVADPTGAMAFLDAEEAAALAEANAAGLSVDGDAPPRATEPASPATPPAPVPTPQQTQPAATPPSGPPEMVPYPALAHSRAQLAAERERTAKIEAENNYLRGLHDASTRAAATPATPPGPPPKHPIVEIDEQLASIDQKYDAEKDALAKRYEDGQVPFADYRKQERALDAARAKEIKPLGDRRTVLMAGAIANKAISEAVPKPQPGQQEAPLNSAAHSLTVKERTDQLRSLEPWVDAVPADWWQRATLREDVDQRAKSLGWNVDRRTEEGLLNYRLLHLAVAKEYGWDKRFGASTAAPNPPAQGSAPAVVPAPSAPVPPTRFPPSLAAGIGRGNAVTDGQAADEVARMSFHDATSLPDSVLDAIAPSG